MSAPVRDLVLEGARFVLLRAAERDAESRETDQLLISVAEAAREYRHRAGKRLNVAAAGAHLDNTLRLYYDWKARHS